MTFATGCDNDDDALPSVRIDARKGAAIKNVAADRIRAIEDFELVLVDAP